MSHSDDETSSDVSTDEGPADEQDLEAQRQEMVDVDAELDAQSDEDGLAAEAGRTEENGISQG